MSGIFYFANYYHLFIGYPPYNPMPIIWSLSVEEHYYIIFPFCMLLCRKNLRGICPGFARCWRWRGASCSIAAVSAIRRGFPAGCRVCCVRTARTRYSIASLRCGDGVAAALL